MRSNVYWGMQASRKWNPLDNWRVRSSSRIPTVGTLWCSQLSWKLSCTPQNCFMTTSSSSRYKLYRKTVLTKTVSSQTLMQLWRLSLRHQFSQYFWFYICGELAHIGCKTLSTHQLRLVSMDANILHLFHSKGWTSLWAIKNDPGGDNLIMKFLIAYNSSCHSNCKEHAPPQHH